jgi:hypothetical protein
VLAEQYRILRAKPAALATDGAPAAAPAAWPPPAAAQRVSVQPAAFTVVQPARRAGLWRRMKQTILGNEGALEDTW